jgi:phosphopantothenoylcysteine decarboxylase / phosphopantothenate---cysteine ligase
MEPSRSCHGGGNARCSHDAIERGRRKLTRKGVDLLVVNDVSAPDTGFDHDTNAVVILDADGNSQEIPLTSKDAVANAVLDRVIAHHNEKRSTT